jgi:hypothetical protein
VPRIRTLKPEITTDEKLARVSRDARLTFVFAITQADDDGLLPGNPRQLLAALFPMDETVTDRILAYWVKELVEIGVCRWRETLQGAPVLEIVQWERHQRVDHKGKSLLRPHLRELGESVEQVSRDSREDVANASRSDLGPRTVDLGSYSAHRDVPSEPDRPPPTTGHDYPPEFEALWTIYPKRHGGNPKHDALLAWRARRKAGVAAETMHAGAERYAAFCAADGILGTKFVMQTVTFLGPAERFLEPWEPPQPATVNGAAPRVPRATEGLIFT